MPQPGKCTQPRACAVVLAAASLHGRRMLHQAPRSANCSTHTRMCGLVDSARRRTHSLQCSLRGTCVRGWCSCDPGWYGTACERKQAGMVVEPGRCFMLV